MYSPSVLRAIAGGLITGGFSRLILLIILVDLPWLVKRALIRS